MLQSFSNLVSHLVKLFLLWCVCVRPTLSGVWDRSVVSVSVITWLFHASMPGDTPTHSYPLSLSLSL